MATLTLQAGWLLCVLHETPDTTTVRWHTYHPYLRHEELTLRRWVTFPRSHSLSVWRQDINQDSLTVETAQPNKCLHSFLFKSGMKEQSQL